jgi:phosphoribosyl-ATP pyrophosphohydrolase/phosphoribosyl-AMP cyclohydrolase
VNRLENVADLDRLDFAKDNSLVTVVTQDARSGTVLMVAHADRDALERTITTGEMHYRSRSRGLWRKGESSGNIQQVVALYHDCDGDAVLAKVDPAGPACHTGATSCFGEEGVRSLDALDHADETIRLRAASDDAPASYTRRLLSDRNLRLKKLGEEAAELAVACADADRDRAVSEAADVIYHVLVALRSLDTGLDDVRATLAKRAASR